MRPGKFFINFRMYIISINLQKSFSNIKYLFEYRKGKSRKHGQLNSIQDGNELSHSDSGIKMLDKPHIINIPVR